MDAEFNAETQCFNFPDKNYAKFEEDPVFSIFFLNPRIHQLGWAVSKGYSYKPPFESLNSERTGLTTEDLQSLRSGFPAMKNQPNDGFFFTEQFNFPHEPPRHSLQRGFKLEAFFGPVSYGPRPATITKVTHRCIQTNPILYRSFLIDTSSLTRIRYRVAQKKRRQSRNLLSDMSACPKSCHQTWVSFTAFN